MTSQCLERLAVFHYICLLSDDCPKRDIFSEERHKPFTAYFFCCTKETLPLNRPCSTYQNSNMDSRLSGQTSIFGVVFFVSKSLGK